MGEGISGKQVKMLREARGWSQGKLAQRAQISQSLLSELENGRRQQVRTGTAAKIAAALGVTQDTLAGAPISDDLDRIVDEELSGLLKRHNLEDIAQAIADVKCAIEAGRETGEWVRNPAGLLLWALKQG